MEEMSTLCCINIFMINKRNHRQHDRENGKIQVYFKGIFSGARKHKGEEGNEIPFKIIK